MILKVKFNRLGKVLCLVILLVVPMLSFGADQARALFATGNARYAKAQYKEARNIYQQLVDGGYQSAPLYFNLGNASFKTGDVPLALLYYEKVHKLSPGDEDINFNIRFANLKTTDKIDEVPEFFLANWWKAFILSFSVHALSVLSILLVLSGSAVLIIYLLTRSVSIKKISFYSAIILLSLGVVTIFVTKAQMDYFSSHRQAIIFSSSVTVKSGPLEQSHILFVLHDGTKVNILDSSNGWMKIRLGNGNEGWIKGSDVREI